MIALKLYDITQPNCCHITFWKTNPMLSVDPQFSAHAADENTKVHLQYHRLSRRTNNTGSGLSLHDEYRFQSTNKAAVN
jgi:hypothetical protein